MNLFYQHGLVDYFCAWKQSILCSEIQVEVRLKLSDGWCFIFTLVLGHFGLSQNESDGFKPRPVEKGASHSWRSSWGCWRRKKLLYTLVGQRRDVWDWKWSQEQGNGYREQGANTQLGLGDSLGWGGALHRVELQPQENRLLGCQKA